jgi:large subunit ribosomal protein L25
VEVECLPNKIPDAINMDISALKVNESLHVRDIKELEGVKILTDPDTTLVSIQPPMTDAKLEAMLAAAPAAETGEPEVVKKAAKEGEAEAAAPAAKGAAPKEGAAKEAGKKEAAPKK